MFRKKYKATLKYKTYNNFIVSREDEVRLGILKLFFDIEEEYNVEIIKHKVTTSNTYTKSFYKIDKNTLSYEVMLESKNRDDLEKVVDMLDKYVFDMFSIKDCKIEKV